MTQPVPGGASRRGSHYVGVFDECQQRWSYQHLLKLEPRVEPGRRGLGTVLHLGLAARYLRMAGGDCLEPIEAMRQETSRRLAHLVPEAEEIYRAYERRWAGEADQLRVLAVEQEVEATLDGEMITARPDLVIEQGGIAYVIDHKSSSGDVASHHREWEMRRQMILLEALGELLIAPSFGLPFGGVLINTVGTRRDRSSGGYEFARNRVLIERALREPALRAMAEILREADAARASGRDPWQYRRNNDACRGRYGMCNFAPLCVRGQAALYEYESKEG